MKRIVLIVFLVLITLIYGFLYISIELELKFQVERAGVSMSNLIDASFKIRKFIGIQLIIFIIMLVNNLYWIFKKS